MLSQKLTIPEVRFEPPEVTEAVNVTGSPHATVVTAEPPDVIAREVAVSAAGE